MLGILKKSNDCSSRWLKLTREKKKKRKYGLLHLLCIKGRGTEILITAPLPFHHFHPKAVNLPHTDNRGTPNIPFKKLLKNPQSKRQSGSEEYEDPLK